MISGFTDTAAHTSTDMLPLTPHANLPMKTEALISLLIVAHVAVRVVDILAQSGPSFEGA
ncbi:hypothetical protein [Methylobacterium sp. GC_Met_2]|uniref:hypothetical protein n=1 Tax=Methylobacterium sp. GC_Met_2 TaxID=2937376 RepID=UPI00226B58F7|nr:hypothetical protein [Methylobacterium sp. GC_Met_2]